MTSSAEGTPRPDDAWRLRNRDHQAFKEAVAALPDGPVTELLRARVAYTEGRLDECLQRCAVAEEGLTEPRLWRARLVELRAITLTDLGLDGDAREQLSEAWEIYEHLGDAMGRASVRQNTATLAFQSAQTCRELYEEALEIAEGIGADDLVGIILLNLENVVELEDGDPRDRLALVRRAQVHLEASWPTMALFARCRELDLLLAIGDPDAVRLGAGLPRLDEVSDQGTRCQLALAIAGVATARGDDEHAATVLDEALAYPLVAADEIAVHEVRAEVLERLGRYPEAIVALRRALDLRRDSADSSAATAARALDVWHRTAMLRADREREKDRADQLERALHELHRATRRIQELSVRDAVTGLHNRQYLMQTARTYLAAGTASAPVQLALVDLDHFKRINDDHGHASGDLVLRQFAGRLRAHLPMNDIVVRHGGEEFVVIRQANDADRSLAVDLDALRPLLADAVWHGMDDERLPAVTMSAGVTTVPGCGGDCLDSALARADALMYRAKREGRDAVRSDTGP